MTKIEKDSTKYLIIQIAAITIAGIIIWPLFDLITCKFFTNSKFIYSISDHIIKPIVFGIIIGLVFWAVENKRKKD